MMDERSYWQKTARNRTRRQLLAGGLGFAGASILAACGAKNNPSSSGSKPATAAAGQSGPPPGPPAKLSVSIGAADPAYLTVYLAKSAGIFERNGLLVDIQTIAGPQALQALVAKGIQIATAGAGETLSAAVAGVDLSIVASPNPSFAGYIYVGPNIKSPSDLKGKKAGITSPGGTYDTLMRACLPKIGLEPDKDVTFIATGSITNDLAALLTDAVQVAPSAIGPNSIKLEAAGFHSIFDPAGIPFAAASTVMQKAWIASNHEVAQRYVDSIIESIARQKKDKAGTIAALKDFLGVSDQQVLEVTYNYFSQDKITVSQPYPKPELFAIQLDQIGKQNAAAKGFDISKVIDPSFVDSAVKRGLDKG